MNGAPRKKRPTEYLKFRPYEAIGGPQVAKSFRQVASVAALKGSVIALVAVGIPSLFLLPLLTYLLNEFVDFPIYLGQVARNAIIPAVLMVMLAVIGGVVSFFRS